MVTIKSKLEDICNFLKPGKPELIIAGGSLPFSFISGAFTYMLTKNLYYTVGAALAPQMLEYSLFRAMECGVLGKRMKYIIKHYAAK